MKKCTPEYKRVKQRTSTKLSYMIICSEIGLHSCNGDVNEARLAQTFQDKFFPPVHLMLTVRGFTVSVYNGIGAQKLGARRSKKSEDIFIHLDPVRRSVLRTDRPTDGNGKTISRSE